MTRMQIDKELLNFAATIVGEIEPALNPVICRKIAHRAIRLDHLGDEAWVKRQAYKFLSGDILKKKFMPRYHMEPFKKEFGEDAIDFLIKYLVDPVKIGPGWAAQFMATVRAIGREVVEQQDNVYEFVTSHPEWENSADARLIYQRAWQAKNNTGE